MVTNKKKKWKYFFTVTISLYIIIDDRSTFLGLQKGLTQDHSDSLHLQDVSVEAGQYN